MVFSLLDQATWNGICDIFVTVVCYLKDMWSYLLDPKAPRIQKVKLVYVRDGEQDESDMTVEYKVGGAKYVLEDLSDEVTDFFFEVHYDKYVYLTRDPNHTFPPKKPPMSFRVPIKEAFLLDSEGVAMTNITGELKKYEGPNCDFHGETIWLRDLDINEPGCTAVRFVSVTDVVTEYDLDTDSISHQTIWSPSKTLVPRDWQHCTSEPETDSPPPA